MGGDGSDTRRRFLQSLGGVVPGLVAASGSASAHHEELIEAGTDLSPEELIEEMSLGQQVRLTHGYAFGANPLDAELTGLVEGLPELGVPDVKLTDGPVGVRHNEATGFPAGISMISTWDPDRLRAVGHAMGREAKAKDQDVLLAPAFNIVRVPTVGRAFEYFGEDPHLASRGAVAVVEGIQDAGTIATAKHYVANNQEGEPFIEGSGLLASATTVVNEGSRFIVDSKVGERALREIYLPAFRAAVTEAEVGGVMTAYNSVNGSHMSENRRLLREVLKGEWDFDGFTVSDWVLGVRSTEAAARAGLDLEMPYGVFFGADLYLAVLLGTLPESLVAEKARRLLGQLERFGILENERVGPPGAANTAAHQRLARQTAAEGAVLLRNETGTADGDPVLPIDPAAVDSLAVIGHEIDQATVGGGGSSAVTPPYSVSPLTGIESRVLGHVTVETAKATDDTAPAVSVASDADVAVVFVQGSSAEGYDRRDMVLDGNQNQLVADVAAANERTVVVCNTGGPVTMPWATDVPAVLQCWYPGMEDGNATADLLFGDVTPGGKLPVTFGKQFADYPVDTPEQYPGVDNTVQYSEGVFVGYRHFDAAGVEPLFPFGHGESYTGFSYGDPSVSSGTVPAEGTIEVSVTVENTGDRRGSEVVQVYVGDDAASVDRPPKELAGFEKVWLDPGERTDITISLSERDFAYFSEREDAWVVDPGSFTIHVGSSSRDIRGTATVRAEHRQSTPTGTGEDSDSGEGTDDSDDGCYVTTATAGDGPTRDELREFRDDGLAGTRLGDALVDLYYRHAPPVATVLERYPASTPARLVTRYVHGCGDLARRRNEAADGPVRAGYTALITVLYVLGVALALGCAGVLRAAETIEETVE